MQTGRRAVIHMQHVSASDLHSNANLLVCLTFQWCSGHLNSIFCQCSRQWGPCQGEPRRRLRNKESSSSCITRNQFRNTRNSSSGFFFYFHPLFPGLASVSPMPVAARGMSVILASGEMLFQGRQLIKVSDKCWGGNLRFTFPPGGEKLHTVALTLNPSTCCFFFPGQISKGDDVRICQVYNQKGALKQSQLFTDITDAHESTKYKLEKRILLLFSALCHILLK